jgi:chorismate dehydratase
MTTNVGRMPYLNSALFYQAMNENRITLHPLVPTAMAAAARSGEIDAGPIPLLDALDLDEGFESLGGYCIATVDQAASILLFSAVPIEELNGKRVAVTGETSTSVRLLKVLLSHRFHVKPEAYVALEDEADAMLLIGDAALQARHGVEGLPHRYDLGEEWRRWTGLPTVFALWIVRRDLPQAEKLALQKALRTGLDRGIQSLEEATAGRPDLGMSGDEVRQYLEGFSYRLGAAERESMDMFTRLLDELSLPEEAIHAGRDQA